LIEDRNCIEASRDIIGPLAEQRLEVGSDRAADEIDEREQRRNGNRDPAIFGRRQPPADVLADQLLLTLGAFVEATRSRKSLQSRPPCRLSTKR
jgi:hypothetical protein